MRLMVHRAPLSASLRQRWAGWGMVEEGTEDAARALGTEGGAREGAAREDAARALGTEGAARAAVRAMGVGRGRAAERAARGRAGAVGAGAMVGEVAGEGCTPGTLSGC